MDSDGRFKILHRYINRKRHPGRNKNILLPRIPEAIRFAYILRMYPGRNSIVTVRNVYRYQIRVLED